MNINDLLKGYHEDPNHQKQSEEIEAAMVKRREQIKIVEHDFIAAWRSHGFPEIESTGDIKDLKKRLDVEQVEFILKWLPKIVDTLGSRDFLVRALILAAKPFDGRVFTELFDDPDSSFHLKWAIGNTIDSTRVLNITQWLRSKFESLSLGKEKEMLVSALPKYLDTEEAKDYLLKIFDHYPLHAADALAKIGNRSDLEFILNKLAFYKGPGRASINKSVKKLEKRLLKSGL